MTALGARTVDNPIITLTDIEGRGFDRAAFDKATRVKDVTAISESHPHNFMNEEEMDSYEGRRLVKALRTLGIFHEDEVESCNETWAEHNNEAMLAGHLTNPCNCRGCRGWRTYLGANSTIDYIESLRIRYIRATAPQVDDGIPF